MNWAALYSGYKQTPLLWEGELEKIEQLEVPPISDVTLTEIARSEIRLGMLAEHFTFEYWQQIPQIKILAHNIQVQGKQATLGEIDAILRVNKKLVHVEIAYKIYLYDPKHGTSEIEHWIGPNRKDTLTAKLNHLKTHQLPLIHSPEGQAVVQNYRSIRERITSKVWMKGQLFLPIDSKVDVSPLNLDCVMGYYLSKNELIRFETYKFYLPTKLEWMMPSTPSVNWKSFIAIKNQIEPLLEREYSPMLWIKSPKGVCSRLFVVWW